MAKILDVKGRRVWDSRGRATVEAEVIVGRGTTPLASGRAIAPAGASTGAGGLSAEATASSNSVRSTSDGRTRAMPSVSAIDRAVDRSCS